MLNICYPLLTGDTSLDWEGPNCSSLDSTYIKQLKSENRKGCCLLVTHFYMDEWSVGTIIITKEGKIFHIAGNYRDCNGGLFAYQEPRVYIQEKGDKTAREIPVAPKSCVGYWMPHWGVCGITNISSLSENTVYNTFDGIYKRLTNNARLPSYGRTWCSPNQIFTLPNICRKDYSYFGLFGEPEGSWCKSNNYILDIVGCGVYNYKTYPSNEILGIARSPHALTEEQRQKFYEYLVDENKLYWLSFKMGGKRTLCFNYRKAQKTNMFMVQMRSNDRNKGGRGYGWIIIWSREQLKYAFR